PFVSNSSNFTRVFELLLAARLSLKICKELKFIFKRDEGDGIKIHYSSFCLEDTDDLKQVMPISAKRQSLWQKAIVLKIEDIPNYPEKILTFEYFALDAIYTLSKLLEIIHLFGPNFLIYHTVLGVAHKRMGDWIRWYKNYLRFLQEDDRHNHYNYDRAHMKLKEILEEKDGSIFNIDASYQYERAREFFYLALQTHNQGKEYQNQIKNLYYLEDDYNDDLMHFFVARERYSINSNYIRKQLTEIGVLLSNTQTDKFHVYYKDYVRD
ncbi:MAG: hypothetical protein AAFN93_29575, partial [Bacteroidota bacterium]